MGIPRSSLVKKPPVARAQAPVPIVAPVMTLTTDTPSRGSDVPRLVAKSEAAKTTPVIEPDLEPTMPARAAPFAWLAAALRTEGIADVAPERPPMRMTWESIAMVADPILDAKQTPEVAARRARFTRLVKGMLVGCAALCILAALVTALSDVGSSSMSTPTKTRSAHAKSEPSSPVVPVEPVGGAKRVKAPSHGRSAKVTLPALGRRP